MILVPPADVGTGRRADSLILLESWAIRMGLMSQGFRNISINDRFVRQRVAWSCEGR